MLHSGPWVEVSAPISEAIRQQTAPEATELLCNTKLVKWKNRLTSFLIQTLHLFLKPEILLGDALRNGSTAVRKAMPALKEQTSTYASASLAARLSPTNRSQKFKTGCKWQGTCFLETNLFLFRYMGPKTLMLQNQLHRAHVHDCNSVFASLPLAQDTKLLMATVGKAPLPSFWARDPALHSTPHVVHQSLAQSTRLQDAPEASRIALQSSASYFTSVEWLFQGQDDNRQYLC